MKKYNKRPHSKPRRKPHPGSAAPAALASDVRASPRAVAGTTLVRRSQAPARHARPHTARAMQRDDRFALSLLLMPFLIVAVSLGAERTLRQLLAGAPALVTAERGSERRLPPSALADRPERIAAIDASRVPPAVPSLDLPAPQLPSLALIVEPPALPMPSLALIVEPPAFQLPSLALIVEPPALPMPSLALIVEPPALPLPSLALIIEPPALPLPSLALIIEPPALPLPSLALIVEPPPLPLPSLALIIEPPTLPLPSLALIEKPPICTAKPGLFDPRSTALAALPPAGGAAAFGLAVAEAAKAQLNDFVIYNAKYQRIAYPMGDVAPLFGVCSDVVVRAYRAVGLDLQALIHETRSGRGDRNIDHRRVDVIRKFLGRHGETLPITDLAEDYQPGDIVTYYRPQNRSSTAHIAIVTDLLAPSGRPMIVHNRGWGPQLEDALFVDKITGHYRFTGLKPPPVKGKPSVLARQHAEP